MPTSNVVYRFGDRTSYKTLTQSTEPIPTLKDHEVLIEVRGVTLNYRDLVIANSNYPGSVTEHVVPCSDGAGVVTAMGSSVEDIQVGDRVITNFDVANMYGPVLDGGSHWLGGTLDGMLRQYAAVPAQAVTKIPEGCKLNFVQLASLVCAGVTAWNALYGLNPLRPGQVVLLQGTGGVSIFGLQLAKAAGATTIITSSSDEKLQFVKEKFGFEYTFNYRKTPENGVEQGCTVRGVQIGSKQLTEELVRVVTSQNIQPHIHKTFGFDEEDVHAAFSCLETAGHIGKIGIAIKSD
ncbi:Chitin synthase [Phytophthora nicotianae]|uniref:Chitin synthase n=1 Tax=Phytophthora nicotianae TaxID=4792 RepID=A0A0W8DHD0_PHYNI|nr:Chitin synthase [Phytophthora nicotianae]